MPMDSIEKAPLGKKVTYCGTYTPTLLHPVSRRFTRTQLNLSDSLPFFGTDIWNAYELSWLNSEGKPEIGFGVFAIPSSSPNLIESKSLKLYLNSFNQTKFETLQLVKETIAKDLSYHCGQDVQVEILIPPFPEATIKQGWKQSICIDHLPVVTDVYDPCPDFLSIEEEHPQYEERVCTHLFKSNCLKTGQPDWASVYIHYKGPKIEKSSLLKYLISYRNHQGFHEQCVEQIFNDIFHRCYSQQLTIYARYTRRGGLDINPFRSNFQAPSENERLFRQ